MSGFDDLQFSGFTNSTTVNNTGYCAICQTTVTIESNHCMSCGFPCIVGAAAPIQHTQNNTNNTTDTNNHNTRTAQYNQLVGNTNNIVQFDPTLITQYLSQQNVDIEQLMTQLMSADSTYNTKAVSSKFIDALQPIKLTKQHFVKVVMDVQPQLKQILPTQATFGTDVVHKHEATGSAVQTHYKSTLILSNTVTGNEIHNSSEFNNNIVLMTRGVIPFSKKAQTAVQHNAQALIVVQDSQSKFPFTITDTTNTSSNINIPVLMISYKDGYNIQQALNSGSKLTVSIQTHISELCCAICMTEYTVDTDAIELPCKHVFCDECIKPWLKKHSSSCPVCRYQLPTDDGSAERRKKAEIERKYNNDQLDSAMFN